MKHLILIHEATDTELTLWCLKYDAKDNVPRPMCLQIVCIFVRDAPAAIVAKLRRKFPAAIFVPVMKGWLRHIPSLRQLGSIQDHLTITMLPHWCAFTQGVSLLQYWQNLNSDSNWDIKTMNFGSFLRLPSFGCTLLKDNIGWRKLTYTSIQKYLR